MGTPGGSSGASGETVARQQLMRACVHATESELEAAVTALGRIPAAVEIRPLQTGLVMLRGRIGGNGRPFNVGEATVTRAAVQLATGAIGVAYHLGRSQRCAHLSALLDALGQDDRYRGKLEAGLVAPVMARAAEAEARARAETAATRVDFFTLVRGED